MVEVGGVEPPSCGAVQQDSTSLVRLSHLAPSCCCRTGSEVTSRF